MRPIRSILPYSALVTIWLAGFLWAGAGAEDARPALSLRNVKQDFHEGLDRLGQAVATYQDVAERWSSGRMPVDSLKEAHLQTRLAFKRVEALLEYYDRSAVRRYLNGAPLPSVDRKAPGVTVLEPEGLQVLDELVFSESPYTERVGILNLVDQLNVNYNSLQASLKRVSITHRHVMEACRLEAIRIFTLGLTGFDTPASGAALEEARVSQEAIFRMLQAYRPLLLEDIAPLADSLSRLESRANDLLGAADDFDSFDRLSYLLQVTNPLLEIIGRIQQHLGIEYGEEAGDPSRALNHHAGNLFAPDILNETWFSKQFDTIRQEERRALGRFLFYDPLLSATGTASCATCHAPEKAFTDGYDRSPALNGIGKTLRNVPTLLHSLYAEHYFLDLRESFLERQMKHVVLDEKEFNTDFFRMAESLDASAEYRDLFRSAFPGENIDQGTISRALAAYVASLAGWQSPFDRYVRGEGELPPAARRGFNLFMGKAACGTCHFAPVFNGTVPPLYEESESEVLGVPDRPDTLHMRLDPDPGRYTSGKPHDEAPFYRHSFKTTTVRNAAITAPYMHNGVYASLREVLDFYNRGGGAGMGLDVPYQTLPADPLGLTDAELLDLEAFMQSLTDTIGFTARPTRLPDAPGRKAAGTIGTSRNTAR